MFPLVSFFCAFALSTTTKKSPSAFDVEVVNSDKSTLTLLPSTSINVPAPTFSVTEPPKETEPPLTKPLPALTVSDEFASWAFVICPALTSEIISSPVTCPPNEMSEPAMSIDEFCSELLGILDRPKVIVPDEVIGEPESTSIPSVPLIATEVTVPELLENGKSDTKPFLTLLSVASW